MVNVTDNYAPPSDSYHSYHVPPPNLESAGDQTKPPG